MYSYLRPLTVLTLPLLLRSPSFLLFILCGLFRGIYGLVFLGYLLSQSPPARKPLLQVRKPNLHSDSGQDLNSCSWRPLGPKRTNGSTVPRRPQVHLYTNLLLDHLLQFAVRRMT
ncbi:hypothetical protein E2C01_066387 [Portunus trituberculatus]|uniref:Uncharacterized protein n=1 Tax=Portunus trituberculatus TaxID=210409 RepID=A0A5B7HUJ0_PORTR|nr:hypothetical protein [Portunus trituberculatus]